MMIFRSVDDVPADFGRTVVAIGKFDGVHVGHRVVLDHARTEAQRRGARSVAVTFDRNPLSVVRPEICPASINTIERKLELLAETGVDATLMLTFDEDFAEWEAHDFVVSLLVRALRAQTVLVGRDFRFGRGGSGDPELLAQLGQQHDFEVEVVNDVFPPGESRRVSSTWVRERLEEGDVAGAARLLGHPVDVRGVVVQGHQRGRELGFPTANLPATTDLVVPADGVYAGWLIDDADGVRWPAAISVGTNPTFGDVRERKVEAFIIDRDWVDLYGHHVSIEFTERLRGMVAFEGVEALKLTMADDVRRAREILAGSDH